VQPGDPLFGLQGADTAVTFVTDILATVTIVQSGSTVVRGMLPLPLTGPGPRRVRVVRRRPNPGVAVSGFQQLLPSRVRWPPCLTLSLPPTVDVVVIGGGGRGGGGGGCGLRGQADTAFGEFADMMRACRPVAP
jgi:hypothetical protein